MRARDPETTRPCDHAARLLPRTAAVASGESRTAEATRTIRTGPIRASSQHPPAPLERAPRIVRVIGLPTNLLFPSYEDYTFCRRGRSWPRCHRLHRFRFPLSLSRPKPLLSTDYSDFTDSTPPLQLFLQSVSILKSVDRFPLFATSRLRSSAAGAPVCPCPGGAGHLARIHISKTCRTPPWVRTPFNAPAYTFRMSQAEHSGPAASPGGIAIDWIDADLRVPFPLSLAHRP